METIINSMVVLQEPMVVENANGISEINFVGDQITATGRITATITVLIDFGIANVATAITVTNGNEVGIASTVMHILMFRMDQLLLFLVIFSRSWFSGDGYVLTWIIMWSGTSMP